MKKLHKLSLLMVVLLWILNLISQYQIKQLEQRLDEQRQELVNRDKALQKELQDLKRYIQSGEGNGG